MALEEEQGLYDQIKPDLLEKAKDQWVLIKGSELIGVYPTYAAAFQDATSKGIVAPYLIKQVLAEEPVERI